MSREQQRTDVLAALAGFLERLAAINPESDLVRAEELGEANFRQAVPLFVRVLSLFHELRAADLALFPLEVLVQIQQMAQEALAQIETVQAFSLAEANPVAARDALVEAIDTGYARYFQVLQPHINFVRARGADFAGLERQATESLSHLQAFIEEQRAGVEQLRGQVEETVRSVKEAAAEAGVGQQSQVFKNEADKNDSEGRRWLKSALGFGLGAFLYALLFFVFPDIWPAFQTFELPTDTPAQLARSALARLVVLSLLLFGLAYSARFYAASRHNGTVNRHRQNALQTFETFVGATADPETKDAVLIETTRSIFSSQPSGFLRSDGDHESPNTVIEVVRRMAGSG